jgi:prevent-host-death family protein
MSTYTKTEANRKTAELVNEARYTNQPVMITDHGKPAAVLISPDLFARYQALEKAADQAVIDEINARGPRWVNNDDARPMMNEILAEPMTEGREKAESSVMSNSSGGDLPPLTMREGVRYEVAEDLFGDLIGWCAAQIAEEKKKQAPDRAAVQQWIDQVAQYAAERKALRAHDTDAVEAVIAQYGPMVRDLFPGRRAGGH